MKWIFKYSWYHSKRHRISHTAMYFSEPSTLNCNSMFIRDLNEGLARIHYIPVSDDSPEYSSAVQNSIKEVDEKKFILVARCIDWGDFLEGIDEPFKTKLNETDSYEEFSQLVSDSIGWGEFVNSYIGDDDREELAKNVSEEDFSQNI